MLSKGRNVFESSGWILTSVEDFSVLSDFDCGDLEINDFFQNDCQVQKQELLNVTYALIEATVEVPFPAALISLCNDAIRKQKIIHWLGFTSDSKKIYPFYPAVKIARLGVIEAFQGKGIGTHLVNMIKEMFVTNNRTGCRFITVDSKNNEKATKFYEKNEFQYITDKDKKKNQRAMFYDLKRLEI